MLQHSKADLCGTHAADLWYMTKRIMVLLKSRYSSTLFWQAATQFFLTLQVSNISWHAVDQCAMSVVNS